MQKLIMMFLIALACNDALAAIYKGTDQYGRIVYSNDKKEGFVELEQMTEKEYLNQLKAKGWEEFGASTEDKMYVAPDSVRRKGDKVKLWFLSSYFKPEQSPVGNEKYWSAKRQVEIDCKEEQSRSLAYSAFSLMMGEGKLVYSTSDPTTWSPVEPNSRGALMMEYACNKK